MMNRQHNAMYGAVMIRRAFCARCKGYALVVDGKLQCCDLVLTEDSPTKIKRMSDCFAGRRGPSSSWKHRILTEQSHRCFYCSRMFGGSYFRNGKPHRLRTNWDHVSPHAYSLDNREQNFVAACNVCNLLKNSKIFNSTEEARSYLFDAWERKGFSDRAPGMRQTVSTEMPVQRAI